MKGMKPDKPINLIEAIFGGKRGVRMLNRPATMNAVFECGVVCARLGACLPVFPEALTRINHQASRHDGIQSRSSRI